MKLLEEKEAVINAKKRKIQDEDVRERDVIDELTAALEQERQLRHLYERMFTFWASFPVLSQLLAKANTLLLGPSIAHPNVGTSSTGQTRGAAAAAAFTGFFFFENFQKW
ncbi:unnamed protein product [Gongylonema pulchrum]|uniref:Uncharacterized protein n=1 Tax=Gongylonema pulchrum TaxID=637853 RepID=A0A183EYE8_9BILA|nr:unnamed protein product [Gongylonema pulchrum]